MGSPMSKASPVHLMRVAFSGAMRRERERQGFRLGRGRVLLNHGGDGTPGWGWLVDRRKQEVLRKKKGLCQRCIESQCWSRKNSYLTNGLGCLGR